MKTNQAVESHTRKAVQMHHLARNFTSQLKEKVEKETLTEFGTTFHYKKVFPGKTSEGDGSLRFCNGNLAEGAIKNFFAKHKCNFYCSILQLKLLPLASQ